MKVRVIWSRNESISLLYLVLVGDLLVIDIPSSLV